MMNNACEQFEANINEKLLLVGKNKEDENRSNSKWRMDRLMFNG